MMIFIILFPNGQVVLLTNADDIFYTTISLLKTYYLTYRKLLFENKYS